MLPVIIHKKPEEDEEILSESDKEMLNLIAEMVVQIIIKKTENECDRLCKDK